MKKKSDVAKMRICKTCHYFKEAINLCEGWCVFHKQGTRSMGLCKEYLLKENK